jgi:hypothetical protein
MCASLSLPGLTDRIVVLEATLLVGSAQTAIAFGIAFDLVDFNERLGPGPTAQDLGRMGRPPELCKGEPPAQVRVVRNGHDLTLAGTGGFEPFPEPFRPVLHLHGRSTPLGHSAPSKDHIAMKVAVSWRIGGPLIARERRKFARFIKRIGILLDLVPEMPSAFIALVLGADATLPSNLGRPTAPRAVLRVEWAKSLVGANLATCPRLVGRIVDIFAEMDFSKPDIMVRDGHEIQRNAQAEDAAVGPADWIAATIPVGDSGLVAVASQRVCIEGPAGMYVKVAKVRVAL